MWGLGTIVVYFGMVQLGDGLIQDQRLSAAMRGDDVPGKYRPRLLNEFAPMGKPRKTKKVPYGCAKDKTGKKGARNVAKKHE